MSDLAPTLAADLDLARALAEDARSPATLRAYRSDLDRFEQWCERNDVASTLPVADAIAGAWIASEAAAGLSLATLRRRVASLRQAHAAVGAAAPDVADVLRGLARSNARAQDHTTPLEVEALRAAVARLDDSPIGVRDRALLLVGWLGALRRSELVGLDVESLTWSTEGVEIHLAQTKTDATGYGERVRIPAGEATDALRAWLDLAGITSGAVFRGVDRHGNVRDSRLTGRAVGLIVKKRCGDDFSAHSLRAGFATSASRAGRPDRITMAHTRHKSHRVFARYAQDGRGWLDNAAVGLL